jgi:predicted nucleotidyltransferase
MRRRSLGWARQIAKRPQEGRRIYFRAETASPVFAELRDLFSKTAAVVPLLQAELEAFGPKITWAAIYGSIARDEERAQSDVDLMIGAVSLLELLPALRRAERQFGREVNVTRYSEEEFRAKRHSGNHFLNSIPNLITIVGSPEELEKTPAEGKVRAHKASKKELDELRAVIARDLEGAAIQELSDDRRFATAYNAALQASKMAILCAWETNWINKNARGKAVR